MTKEDHDTIQLKLLCGGDVLESFAVPGLWKDEDVSVCKVKVTNIEFKLSVPCISVIYMGLAARKSCLPWFANKKGADQPVHPRSLTSALVIRWLKSMISRLATNKISVF